MCVDDNSWALLSSALSDSDLTREKGVRLVFAMHFFPPKNQSVDIFFSILRIYDACSSRLIKYVIRN